MSKPKADMFRKNTRFIDVLQHFLNRGLQTWAGKDLNRESMGEMYEFIREGIHDLFSKSSQNFTSDTKDWISQQLYLTIKIGGQGELVLPDGDNLHPVAPIFDPMDIKKIPTDELRIVGSLLSDCEFAPLIADELRRRS